ncbi:MAG: hypothetical protein V1871_00735 [Planctomycetota bacterium]
MNFTVIPQHVSIILLYDPCSLEKVSLDNIKESGGFDIVTQIENAVILLGNQTKKTKVTFQPIRLEFTDENNSSFKERDFSNFISLVTILPTLAIKAIGINIFCRLDFADNFNTSQFISDNFLKDKKTFEDKVKNKVISTSTRIFYGDTNDHFDLRLTPVDLNSSKLGIQLHRHKDINVVDTTRQTEEVKKLSDETIVELDKIIKEIFEKK